MGFEFLAPFNQYPTPLREEMIYLRLKKEVVDTEAVVIDVPLEWKSMVFEAVNGYCFMIKSKHEGNDYYCRIYPGVDMFVYLSNDLYHRTDGPSTLHLKRSNRNYKWHIHGRRFSFSEYLERQDEPTQKEMICQYL